MATPRRRTSARATTTETRDPARRAFFQFLLRCTTAVVLVAIATFLVSRSVSERLAIDDARARGDAFTRGVVAPLVNADIREMKPGAAAEFDRIMLSRLKTGAIVHMKLWDVDGTVLWSDERGLIGQVFDLDAPVKARAGTSFVHAELSDLDEPENELESDVGKLLEVYVGTKDADGNPMIFETYWSASRLHADEQSVLWVIAPLTFGALLLLMLLLVPLGVTLARTSTRTIRERNRMLHHALSAADLERRRVSQLLHDRVVQDLAGIGYALPSAAEHVPDGPGSAEAREIIEHATDVVREDVNALRTMLVDIYPPSLSLGELAPALHELAAKAEESGVVVSVEIWGDDSPALGTSQLIYRIVREGLLNVVEHSEASRAWVRVRVTDQKVDVSISDNGPALRTAAVPDRDSGHFGLRLLHDAVSDLGGELSTSAAPAGGTVLRGWFPVSLTRS
ncbi:MAG: hypothetical protein J7518_14885 [Nocardioidaceae bacterium]|nr:hypothetical protein [Nocardioidaceae bacterium]